ncbi:MAG TPA: hypothetical protein VLV87_04500 [Gammaproteobacteria bacterium]|nr:hypothetical protein [Gammaproteobacteria bacterium]
MPKCSKEALLGAVLCAFAVTAWGGPIIIPVPGASTGATPPPAYGSPGTGAFTAPVAATVPAPAPAAPPVGPGSGSPPAKPSKPKPDFSRLDVSGLLVQPFGAGDVGHGEKITVSDAISRRSFLILDGARFDSGGEVRHSFDVGIGLNTSDDSSGSFYATLTWTGIGFQTEGTPGTSGHGYAVAAGVRVIPLPSLELDAEARYDNDTALDSHTSGQIGMFYQFTRRLWVGLMLGTSAMENDYLLTLRWTFGRQ